MREVRFGVVMVLLTRDKGSQAVVPKAAAIDEMIDEQA